MANLILKKKKKTTTTTDRTWETGINTPVSLRPFVKLYIQTSLPSTKPPLCVSNPNQCHWPTFKELMRVMSHGPENVPSPNFCAPCSLPSHDQPVAHGHPIYYPILLAIRNWRWKNNSGVSRSWEPDPIVFCKSKKDQLSMVQICIPTPESVVTLTKKKPFRAQEQSRLSAERRWCQLSDYKLLIYASTAAKSSK